MFGATFAAQGFFQGAGLRLGLAEDRRAAADLGVDLRGLGRAPGGDEARQRQAQPGGQGDDRRIAEQIAQKGLHRLERIRPAEIEQDDGDFHLAVIPSEAEGPFLPRHRSIEC